MENIINAIMYALMAAGLLWLRTDTSPLSASAARPVLLVLAITFTSISVLSIYSYIKEHHND